MPNAELVTHRSSTLRVLAVDDDPLALTLLVVMIRDADPDVHVETFPDANAALAHARKQGADLVITDYQMPQLDGGAFITMLRNIRAYATVPVVVVTGAADPPVVQRMQALGAMAVLEKPVSGDDLLPYLQQARARCGI